MLKTSFKLHIARAREIAAQKKEVNLNVLYRPRHTRPAAGSRQSAISEHRLADWVFYFSSSSEICDFISESMLCVLVSDWICMSLQIQPKQQ